MNAIKLPSEYFINFNIYQKTNSEIIEKWNHIYSKWNNKDIEYFYCSYLYLNHYLGLNNLNRDSDDMLFVNNKDLKLWITHCLNNKYSHQKLKDVNFYLFKEIMSLKQDIQHHSILKEIIIENNNPDYLTNGIIPFFINTSYTSKNSNIITDNLYSIRNKFSWLEKPELIAPLLPILNPKDKKFLLETINKYHKNNNNVYNWNREIEFQNSKVLLLDFMCLKDILKASYFDFYEDIKKINNHTLNKEQELIHFKTLLALSPLSKEKTLVDIIKKNKNFSKINLKEVFFNKTLEERLYTNGLWYTIQQFNNKPSINSIICGNIHSNNARGTLLYNRIFNQIDIADPSLNINNYYNIVEKCFNSPYKENILFFLRENLDYLSQISISKNNTKYINGIEHIINENNIPTTSNKTYSIIKHLLEKNSIDNWLITNKTNKNHIELFIQKILNPETISNYSFLNSFTKCFQDNYMDLPKFYEFHKLGVDEANKIYEFMKKLLEEKIEKIKKEDSKYKSSSMIMLLLIQHIFISLPTTTSLDIKEISKHLLYIQNNSQKFINHYEKNIFSQIENNNNLIEKKIIENVLDKSFKKSKSIKF